MTYNVLIINRDASWFAKQLSSEFPHLSIRQADTSTTPVDGLEKTEILIALAPEIDDALLAKMPELKLIHALTTGVDNLLSSKRLAADVVLTNSQGIHGPQMSELAILLMLSTTRDYPRMLENQASHQWKRWPQPLLHKKTACIVGLGTIAEQLAVRCEAFGMTITGVSDGRSTVPGFTRVYPRTELPTAASEADYLIVLVPYTDSTHHIVDDTVLQSMQNSAILINLSRGGCIDETALQKHLIAESIHAAALDVFADEPLPENSSLWQTPGLTITPHIGGMSDTYREQVLPVVINNLTAWLQSGDAKLPNQVLRS